MKRIIPVKFVVGVTTLCLIVFPFFAFFLFFWLVELITVDTLPHYAIFLFLAAGLCIELVCLLTPGYNEVVFQNGMVSNHIFDGTENSGWRRDLSDIKNVRLVMKDEVQKYYKQFNKNKAILIEFKNGEVKYIYAGAFSKKQINQMIELINQNKK